MEKGGMAFSAPITPEKVLMGLYGASLKEERQAADSLPVT
jgi:hypothetical protein